MDRPKKRRCMDHSPDRDIEELRAENNARLKSTFESIFEKYGRDFSGIGDEIDLETGKVLVNNGHLLGMKDETDAGAEGYMFDELASEKWSDRTPLGKETGYQSSVEAETGQEPAGGAISDAPCFSDDADSLMGDVINPGLPEAVGSGSLVSRPPDIQSESGNCGLLPLARANVHGTVSDEGCFEADLSARPLQDSEIISWEDTTSEPSWRAPSSPEPVSISRMQPAQVASGDDSAGSKRSSSPVRSFLETSTTWKRKPRDSVMNRWTRQENDLLLCLLSDTTLGYPEIKEQFNKRFPHRHLKAIQDHWNRLRVKDPWKSILDGRIHKHTIAKRCQLKVSPISRTIQEGQHSCSVQGYAESTDLLTPDCASRNAGKDTMSSESIPQQKISLQPDIQQDVPASNTPNPQIDTDVEFLSHKLQEHARFLAALTRPSMVEHDVRLTAVQKVYQSTSFKVAKGPRRDTAAGIDDTIEPKATRAFRDSESPATVENHRSRNPIDRKDFESKANSRRAPNITAMRQAYAMQLSSYVRQPGSQDLARASNDDAHAHDNHENHAKLARGPSATATPVPGNPNPSTPSLNPLSPKVVLIPRMDLNVNREEHEQTLPSPPVDPQLSKISSTPHIGPHANHGKNQETPPSLSANRQFPQSNNIPPVRRGGLSSELGNRLGSSGLSNSAGRECYESLTSSAPVARRKSVGELNKAPCPGLTDPGPPSASKASKKRSCGAVQPIPSAAREKEVEKKRLAILSEKAEEDKASKLKAATPTLGQRTWNSMRSNKASRAIKLPHSAKTVPSIIRTHTPSQAKRHNEGVKLASAKPISPPETDTSDDELSTPIKTVGTPSVSKLVSATLKDRRKTAK